MDRTETGENAGTRELWVEAVKRLSNATAATVVTKEAS